jgi:long-chain acyl-CoA synthetase
MKFILLTIVEYFIILFVNVVHAVYTTIYGKIEFDSSPCSFEVEDSVEDSSSTKPRRNYKSKGEEHFRTLYKGIYTVDEALKEAVKRFGKRKSFGFRKTKIVHSKMITMPDGRIKEWFTPEFESPQFWTYKELYRKVRDFGCGLVKFAGLKEREIFGIFEDTRPEWMVAAHGAIQQNLVITTVYANLGEQNLIKALNETEVTCLMLNAKDVPRVNEMAKFIPNLKYLIYTDELKPNAIKGKLNLKVISYDEVMELGKVNYHEPTIKPKQDDLLLIMYTSGKFFILENNFQIRKYRRS